MVMDDWGVFVSDQCNDFRLYLIGGYGSSELLDNWGVFVSDQSNYPGPPRIIITLHGAAQHMLPT